MNYSVATAEPHSRALPPATAVRWFLNDLAAVSGFAVDHGGRPVSAYVMRKPILTSPDPWFFAGLVALEAAKIVDLFPKKEAGALLKEVMQQADTIVGRRGRIMTKIIFALMGRLGTGAILMRSKVPDEEIGRIIRVLLGGTKDWKHLLPSGKEHAQVYKALGMGTPSWWPDYARAREALQNKKTPGATRNGPSAIKRAAEALAMDVPLDLAIVAHQTAPAL